MLVIERKIMGTESKNLLGQYGLNNKNGQISRFGYDGLNRRISAIFDDGARTEFVYDGVGRLTSITDTASGPISFVYDNLDRLTSEATPQGMLTYAYDSIGRRISMTANGLAPVTYQYDAASRLTQVTQETQIVGLGYDVAGRRTGLTYPNGVTASYTYDPASRITNILHQSTTAIIENLTYTYDAAGNRISFTRTGPQASLPQPVQAAYDAANEQIQFNSTTPNLTYDANGNLTSQTDASGTTNYSWDSRNRLASIIGPGVSASFAYDALGRRISKTINGEKTDYQYDGADIVAEIGGSAISATYIRSLNIDESFVRQAGSNEYYHTDALGSVLGLTTDNGQLATTYSYDPFGNTTITGSSSSPFQYTGRENDGTGLYYYRARYYSPAIQRFISEDPIGLYGGDFNLYAYTRNNPIRYFDPWGLKPGDKYPTQDASAIDAIKDINPKSIAEGREYAGRIYKNPDGTYSYTAPNRGTKDSSNPGSYPPGTTNGGYYHTHGADDPGYDNENFSSADKTFSEREGAPGYLGTPKGAIKKYVPKGKVEILRDVEKTKKDRIDGRK